MNRITVFEKDGLTYVQKEHEAKNPPGDAAQRRKALKSGWKPSFVKDGQPIVFEEDIHDSFHHLPNADVVFLPLGAVASNPAYQEALALIEAGQAIALWADGFVARDAARAEKIERIYEAEFCRKSGLV